MKTVTPGIRFLKVRTPTLPPATATNTLLLGHKRLLIVDPATPYEDERARFDAEVEALHTQGITLAAALITHEHADHYQDALRLRERYHIPIWGHALCEKRLPFKLDRLIEDGEHLEWGDEAGQEQLLHFVALHTPGHCGGHLCLYEKHSETLLAGDMVGTESTILIDPSEGDLESYMQSLKRLLDLRLGTLVPAHGQPTKQGTNLLRSTLGHRRLRIRQVQAMLDEAKLAGLTLTPETITERLYKGALHPGLLPFAVRSVQSTLIWIERYGSAH